MSSYPPGAVVWRDLTVPNASEIKDFYAAVVGWKTAPHPMGDYDDYNIFVPSTDEVVGGVCHARGENAKIPPYWLIYVAVENVEAAVAKCLELGGKVIDGPRKMGEGSFAVIQDPAGGVLGIIEG